MTAIATKGNGTIIRVKYWRHFARASRRGFFKLELELEGLVTVGPLPSCVTSREYEDNLDSNFPLTISHRASPGPLV